MEILDKLFPTDKPAKKSRTMPVESVNEYTDLSDLKKMIQQSTRKQGLGFEEIQIASKKGYVKPLSRKQLISAQKKKQDDKDKAVEQEKIQEQQAIDKPNEKLKIEKKKIQKIEVKTSRKTKKQFTII